MQPDSLKRMVVLGVSIALNLVAPKLGLDKNTVNGINGLVLMFLGQSGVNAIVQKLAASKAAQVAGAVEAAVQGAVK